VQVIVLPISERHHEYTDELVRVMKEHNIRVEADFRSEKTGAKVAQAEVRKIPYILIVGDREVANRTVSVRAHGRRDLGEQEFTAFLESIRREIEQRSPTEPAK